MRTEACAETHEPPIFAFPRTAVLEQLSENEQHRRAAHVSMGPQHAPAGVEIKLRQTCGDRRDHFASARMGGDLRDPCGPRPVFFLLEQITHRRGSEAGDRG